MPPGVINMVTGDGINVSKVALADRDLAGIHFTGSTPDVPAPVAAGRRRTCRTTATYPRLVGETGGKDFILAHPSADPDVLRTAMIRGAFEFQGQKCSAASRAYVPRSLWRQIKGDLASDHRRAAPGRRHRPRRTSWAPSSTTGRSPSTRTPSTGRTRPRAIKVVAGGTYDDSEGYFVRPTVLEIDDPTDESFSHRVLRPDPVGARLPRPPVRQGAGPDGVRRRRTASPARSSPRTARSSPTRASGCGSPPATSTSTTSRPARSSASSRSVAAGPRAPTTRPARRRTSCAGRARARSRRRSCRRRATPTRTWADDRRVSIERSEERSVPGVGSEVG